MIAIHDQFTHQMRNRLKTTCMGLGLVRVLQDARRFNEAKLTLLLLENGFQGVAEKSHMAGQKSCRTKRLKRRTGTTSSSAESASSRIDAAETLSQPLSFA